MDGQTSGGLLISGQWSNVSKLVDRWQPNGMGSLGG